MTFSVALSGFSEGVLGSFELLKHWLAYSQPQCMRPDHLKKEKRQIQNSEFILLHCLWYQYCHNRQSKDFTRSCNEEEKKWWICCCNAKKMTLTFEKEVIFHWCKYRYLKSEVFIVCLKMSGIVVKFAFLQEL